MFDMGKIGVTVSQLRKSQNMTQLELADKLNVSFQAVSNWERGNSMPDISKLPELAQIFGVSIDELLGKESGLIRSAAEGTLQEYLERETPGMDELVDAAPILKPSQMDATLRGLPEEKLDLRQIEDLLPFLGADLLEEFARNAMDAGNMQDFYHVVPYLREDVAEDLLEELARNAMDAGNMQEFYHVVPYLRGNIAEDLLEELARNAMDAGNMQDFYHVVPYLRENVAEDLLEELARNAMDAGNMQDLNYVVQFLKQNAVDQIFEKCFAEGKDVAGIIPFVSQNILAEVAQTLYRERGLAALADYVPALSKE